MVKKLLTILIFTILGLGFLFYHHYNLVTVSYKYGYDAGKYDGFLRKASVYRKAFNDGYIVGQKHPLKIKDLDNIEYSSSSWKILDSSISIANPSCEISWVPDLDYEGEL